MIDQNLYGFEIKNGGFLAFSKCIHKVIPCLSLSKHERYVEVLQPHRLRSLLCVKKLILYLGLWYPNLCVYLAVLSHARNQLFFAFVDSVEGFYLKTVFHVL